MRLWAIAVSCLVFTVPCMAQSPSMQQMLQGLVTGNQGQDHALQEAYERGYQRGRQDEAQRMRGDGRPGRRENDPSRYDDDRGPHQGDRGSGGNNYSR